MQSCTRLTVVCILQFAGCAPFFVPPVLYRAIASSYDIEQAHVTALMPTCFAVSMVAMAIPGSLFIERFGLRRSFIFGWLGICVCTCAQVVCTSFLQLLLLHSAIGVCKGFAGDVAFIAFINAWFHEQTSSAIAICFAAVGAGAATWTLLAARLASDFGWRAALAAVAAVQCTVALPLAALCVRDPPPSRLVRQPSRVARPSALEPDSSHSDRRPWWLTDRSVWLLALLNFAVVFSCYGVNNQLTLFLADEAHVSVSEASMYTSVVFVGNVLSKLASGPLYDGAHGGACAIGACATLTAGSLLLLHLAAKPAVGAEALAFAITFGTGYGGCYSLLQCKASLHFGHRRGFKALQGFLSTGQYAGMACGYLFPPELAHACSYTLSFATLCGSALAALAAIVAFELREASLGVGSSSSSSPSATAGLAVPFLKG